MCLVGVTSAGYVVTSVSVGGSGVGSRVGISSTFFIESNLLLKLSRAFSKKQLSKTK